MEIKIASAEKDFLDIRNIWKERFTSDETYLDTIFKYIFPLCRSYIYMLEGKAVSVISLMPMLYFHEQNGSNNKPLNGFYLFGVATLKEHEGKKLAAKLISYASEYLKTENYDFIFERPANQSLNKYYFNLGFTVSTCKIPHKFKITGDICSSRNIHESPVLKDLSTQILKDIHTCHRRRFEWAMPELLYGLLALGELDEHNKGYSGTYTEETYIAINPLSHPDPSIFKEAFFCFPME